MTSLSDYIADPERRAQLARDAETSTDYLWQIATRWRGRRASSELAKRIERATGGAVSRSTLRPDLWGDEDELSIAPIPSPLPPPEARVAA